MNATFGIEPRGNRLGYLAPSGLMFWSGVNPRATLGRYVLGWHISAFQACARPLLQIDGGVSAIFDGGLQLQRPWGQLPDPPWFNALARKHLVRAFPVSHLFNRAETGNVSNFYARIRDHNK